MNGLRHQRISLIYVIVAAAVVAIVSYWQLSNISVAITNYPATNSVDYKIDLNQLF